MIERLPYRGGHPHHHRLPRCSAWQPDQVTRQMRRRGQGGELRHRLRHLRLLPVPGHRGVAVAEAKEYMERYFADVRRCAGLYGPGSGAGQGGRLCVHTVSGRRRWLPELKSSNFNTRSFGERVALNMPIQGTAADIIKLAMLRVRDRLSTEGMEGRLVLQVHDELIVECPEEEQGRVCALVEEEMERVISLSVPLLAETSAGKSWADAH